MMPSASDGSSINGSDSRQRHVTVLVEEEEKDETAKTTMPAVPLAHRSTTSMIHTVTIKYPQWHNAVAGGVAGAGSRLFTAPLDLVRIRAQLERRELYPRPSILSRIIDVYRAEGGITALFRGNLAASYLWIGYTTVQFSVYGSIKEVLENYRDDIAESKTSQSTQKQPPQYQYQEHLSNLLTSPTAVAFVSGAGAGICATIATYPFDICRTVFASRGALNQHQQQQQQLRESFNSSSTFRPPTTIKECAKSMYQQRGFRGFYAGSTPAVVQIIPYMGLNFAIYDFLIRQGNDNRSSKSVGLSGYAGSISGAVSKIIVYPMDTVKKRIQIQSVFGSSTNVVYSGMWDCLVTSIRMEGILGLYRGLFPSVLKTTLGSGLSFTFFRSTKNLLESIHDNL